MKKEEAVIVINVFLGADGGCPHCAWQLIEAFSEKFPEFKEAFTTAIGKNSFMPFFLLSVF